MIRKILLFTLGLFVFTNAFARSGLLSGTKGEIQVIKTKYFDVIYPEESERTALKIASVCDGYYEEIAGKLGTPVKYRFPVTITPAAEQLNAAFTCDPYNRIYLYDTKPTHSLDMYEETMCYVFYHELTHAITFNMKSPFWETMSNIFGDIVTPAILTTPSFWMEGATVSLESAIDRSGRMNDPYATQMVGVWKLDGGKFPGWRDVTGCRDIYPRGTDAYMFGGLFCRYLQQKYGYEKYGDLWRKCGSLSNINLSFRSVYGRSISAEWKDFEKTVYYPQNVKPYKAMVSNKLSNITCMDHVVNGEKSQVFYFDATKNGVFMIENGRKPKRIITIKSVFTMKIVNGVLIMDRYIDRDNVKIQTVTYNLETKKIKFSDYKDDYERFITEKENYIDENHYSQLYKEGLNWRLMYKDGDVEKRFDFSKVKGKETLVIHNLTLEEKQEEEESYIFSWAEIGKGNQMMSRIGRLVIDPKTHKGRLFLEKEDDFAGVLDVAYDGEDYYAVIQRSHSQPLVKIQLDDSMFEEYEIQQDDYKWSTFVEEDKKDIFGLDKNDFTIKPYSILPYLTKGTWYPMGSVDVYDSEIDEDYSCSLGATYFTSDPWKGKTYTLTGGYNNRHKAGAVQAEVKGGDDTFSYKGTGTFAFSPKDKWKQSVGMLEAEKTVNQGRLSSFGLNFDGKIRNQWDKTSTDVDFYEGTGDVKSGVFWSNIHKAGYNNFCYAGIKFNPFINYQRHWIDYDNDTNISSHYVNAGATATVKIPLIFPWTFTASLYPKRDVFASGSASVVLLNYEIQKGVPLTAIYLSRFYVDTSYSAKLKYKSDETFDIKNTRDIASNLSKDDLEDSVGVSLNCAFKPNIKTLCIPMVVSYFVKYNLHEQDDNKKFKCGITANISLDDLKK